MKAAFPTSFTGHFLGKSRNPGSFNTPDGEVTYGDAYEVAFESSEGLNQVVQIAGKQWLDVGDQDPAKLPRYTELQIIGDVNVNTDAGRSSFRPTAIKVVKASS